MLAALEMGQREAELRKEWAARGLPEGAVDDFAQNMVERVASANGDMASAARDNGLVDELLSRAGLRDVLKEYAGEDKDDESLYSSVSLREYLGQMRLLHGPKPESENVAIVVAVGEILDGTQPPGTVGGDSTASTNTGGDTGGTASDGGGDDAGDCVDPGCDPAETKAYNDCLFAACDERTRAIFISSPNNPTGWVMNAAQQRAVLDFARELRVTVQGKA